MNRPVALGKWQESTRTHRVETRGWGRGRSGRDGRRTAETTSAVFFCDLFTLGPERGGFDLPLNGEILDGGLLALTVNESGDVVSTGRHKASGWITSETHQKASRVVTYRRRLRPTPGNARTLSAIDPALERRVLLAIRHCIPDAAWPENQKVHRMASVHSRGHNIVGIAVDPIVCPTLVKYGKQIELRGNFYRLVVFRYAPTIKKFIEDNLPIPVQVLPNLTTGGLLIQVSDEHIPYIRGRHGVRLALIERLTGTTLDVAC